MYHVNNNNTDTTVTDCAGSYEWALVQTCQRVTITCLCNNLISIVIRFHGINSITAQGGQVSDSAMVVHLPLCAGCRRH